MQMEWHTVMAQISLLEEQYDLGLPWLPRPGEATTWPERLALPTSDHGLPGSNPAEGEILSKT